VRRLELGLSQAQLAKVLGLSFQQIQKYEWGKDDVRATRLIDLADALRTSPAYFIADDRVAAAAHDWETDPRSLAECLAHWTGAYGWTRTQAARQLRLNAKTFFQLRAGRPAKSERLLRRMMTLIDRDRARLEPPTGPAGASPESRPGASAASLGPMT
jgi:DNA-binding XRE family transcriptional regulator